MKTSISFILLQFFLCSLSLADIQCSSPTFGTITIVEDGKQCHVDAHTIDNEDFLQIVSNKIECISYIVPDGSGRTFYSARLYSVDEPDATFSTVIKMKDRKIQEFVITLEWIYSWSFFDFTECVETRASEN